MNKTILAVTAVVLATKGAIARRSADFKIIHFYVLNIFEKISPEYFPMPHTIIDKPILVQKMARNLSTTKPLSEPLMTKFAHILYY